MSDTFRDHAEPASPVEKDSNGAWVDLSNYRITGYQQASRWKRVLWYATGEVLFASPLPVPSSLKCTVLRWFGATIGNGVVIKPRVRIKFPWQLEIGDHTWIGEGTWIDNLGMVRIGSNVCISQGVYFCTGSHDHRSRGFELLVAPITVGDGAWVATRSTLLQGVTIGPNALVAAASMVHKDVAAGTIVGGNPAVLVRHREPPVSL
ncbi:WcaF family extracellular polysaccharide biosynthesis acetyltransferase [Aeoliella sp. SH292]|uniref:WcaF family extracellular polysaccharide biosynthesis acetyltransferase n=1 Tax=Aeoliella sp. SH292 TaxID=3454464 RepID=UPI003F95CF58